MQYTPKVNAYEGPLFKVNLLFVSFVTIINPSKMKFKLFLWKMNN